MKILNHEQGSPEWLAARRKHFTASEAPIIMGASKKSSRRELLYMKATGNEKEFSDYVLNVLFERGHEVEELARPIAEGIIGEELYRVTGSDDTEYLLASCDGLTLLHDIGWEHKLWNEIKAQYITDGDVPPEDYWQLVHQFAVTGSGKILYMVSDGTEENCKYIWVDRDEDDITTLMLAWQQFEQDLEAAKADPASVAPAAPKAEAAAIPALPALVVEIEGDVSETNIVPYSAAVKARIDSISTDLQTDEDFATAENMVKFLKAGEDEIERVKKAALAKTQSIEELFRHLDDLRESMRGKRLDLDKLVKSRKDEIRNEIAQKHMDALLDHIGDLNSGLGGKYLSAPITIADVQAAMKGKRNIDSLEAAADHAVLDAKLQASKQAEAVRANLKLLDDAGRAELFHDRALLVLKDSAIVQAEITNRIAKADEEARKRAEEAERARIRKEENDRIAAEEKQRRQQAAVPAPAAEAKPAADPVQAERDAEWQIPERKANPNAGLAGDVAELQEFLSETLDTLNGMRFSSNAVRDLASRLSSGIEDICNDAALLLDNESNAA